MPTSFVTASLDVILELGTKALYIVDDIGLRFFDGRRGRPQFADDAATAALDGNHHRTLCGTRTLRVCPIIPTHRCKSEGEFGEPA